MMSIRRFIQLVVTITALMQLVACATEGTYRGGVLVQPGPPAIQDHYTFTFMDKWRVSHAWLSGPVDVRYCRYSRRDSEQGPERFFEVDGRMKVEFVSGDPRKHGRKMIWDPQPYIYGTYSDGQFMKGYHEYCGHSFVDIWTSISVLLIKPNPAKGTDEWIADSRPVTVNGLHWLRKDIPIKDYSGTMQGGAPVEIWVLKIPDTSYWLVMRIASSTGGSGTAPGANRDPLKYLQVLDLFHQMVASVRLEPITPVGSNPQGGAQRP